MSSNDAHSRAGSDDNASGSPAAFADRPEVMTRDDNPLPPEDNSLTRRTALKMFSATALLASVAGCTRKPKRHIYSMVDRPEYQRPGIPLYYRSTYTEGAFPYGLVVKTIDGRPIKVDGAPGHPLNDGKSNAQIQASIMSLYDPDRLKTPMRGREALTWGQADRAVIQALKNATSTVLVTRGLLGPSERELAKRFLAAAPGAQHFVHEPAADRVRRAAWKAIYGADGEIVPQFDKADVIVSIDCDFLGTDGNAIANTRGFAASRRPEAGVLSRLYVAEGGMSITGSNADHRIPVRPSDAGAFVLALASADGGKAAAAKYGWDAKLMAALVADLQDVKATGRKAMILAGAHLPASVHAAVAIANQAVNAPLAWNPAPATLPASDPKDITAALDAGPDVAIFLGVNPVYDGVGSGMGQAAAKAKFSVAHGLTANETLSSATIALPSAHNLESWNDAQPRQGMTSFCQPQIAPLFDGRQEADSLIAWTKALGTSDATTNAAKDFHAYVQARSGFDSRAWQDALRNGFVGSAATLGALPAPVGARALVAAGTAAAAGTMDVILAPHMSVGDGRHGGNAWLLETPEPTTQLVWDNAAIMSPATAAKLGVRDGDWVTITAGGATLDLPVAPQPGTQKDTIVAHMGFGRTLGAGVGCGQGFNVFGLSAGELLVTGAQVAKKSKDRFSLVRTQRAHDQMDREIARGASKKEFDEHPDFAKHRRHIVNNNEQIDTPWDYSKGHKWGLGIDLNQCTGCNACMVACQSENNIPIVGKEEVAKGRDMAWIRLDRYEAGDPENPEVSNLPMLCQHCDNAPCETVCPVNATAHSPEGLNDQIYNRCVGTRYCSNNCPYKVRRFNFFNYTGKTIDTPVEELAQNPHVTVRMRGVMEKCTFCVQRINTAKFTASNAGAELKDGDVVTACQEACPADAIVFGDANIKGGAIDSSRAANLSYHVLEELNVRPNVTYQARVRNLHPSLDQGAKKGGH